MIETEQDFNINAVADAAIEVGERMASEPVQMLFARYGLDPDDVLEVVSHLKLAGLTREQAMAFGVAIGVRLARG